MLTLGEVQTGLLQNGASATRGVSSQVLALMLGERVRHAERPIAHAVSPDLLTGVDCPLATSSGARVRGIGTAVSRASITGGHLLQGSAYTQIVKGEAGRRLPWSHYLSRPGFVETVGKVDPADLADGFLAAKAAPASLDLGAMGGRVMDTVQRSAGLDRKPPFRAARTRLRWVVAVDESTQADRRSRFTIETALVRTLRLTVRPAELPAAVELCQDVALHDWLLTALLGVIERSRIGASPRQDVVDRLQPAIDYLLHLWMPAARLDQAMLPLWESFERQPGFSRQWDASVSRIRDQVALSTIVQLGATAERTRGK